MPFEDIKEPDGANALKGMLSLSYWKRIIPRLNLWRKGSVKLPSTANGSGKIIVTEEGWVVDLSGASFYTPPTVTQRLQLINASAAGVPKVQVSYGMIAGFVADSSMTDPTNVTPFVITLASSAGFKYIYCDLPVSYDGSGTWTFTAGEITSASSAPSDTASHAYVEIGTVTVTAITGGFTVNVTSPQTISGDQAIARDGGASTTSHKNWLV